MKPELDNQSVHRYMRVYNYYKQLILSQQLAPGSRLPSIRRCAAELQMSRTTVETAYMVLAAEGYIISRPQSGFYVTDIGRTRKTAEFQNRKRGVSLGKYDLSGKITCGECGSVYWRRYRKNVKGETIVDWSCSEYVRRGRKHNDTNRGKQKDLGEKRTILG